MNYGNTTAVYTTDPNVTMSSFAPFSPTNSPLPEKARLGIGVTLSVIGNLMISVAMNVQKHSHNLLVDTGRSYLRSITWWCGMILMVLGEVGNFTAYGFAPASLVAPLGTTAVIANAIIAVVFLKEKIRGSDVIGITLAIAGAVLLVKFANKRETMVSGDEIVNYIKSYPFIVYMMLELLVFLVIVYLHNYRNYITVVSILLQVAILGSLTVIGAKAVSSMMTLSFSGNNQLIHPVFYIMLLVMIASAIGQVKFLNQAMASFDTTVVMPTNFVFFTVSAIIGGIAFYQEFYGLSYLQVMMILTGISLSFGGVYLITAGINDGEDGSDGEKTGLLPAESEVSSPEAVPRNEANHGTIESPNNDKNCIELVAR